MGGGGWVGQCLHVGSLIKVAKKGASGLEMTPAHFQVGK